MAPWLHLLFIPAVLLLGVQIGIRIGLRLAGKSDPAGVTHGPTDGALAASGAGSH